MKFTKRHFFRIIIITSQPCIFKNKDVLFTSYNLIRDNDHFLKLQT